MKVRVLVHLTGLINGQPWPEPGGVLELADAAAETMIAAGHLEQVKGEAPKVEKRPTQVKAEQRAD